MEGSKEQFALRNNKQQDMVNLLKEIYDSEGDYFGIDHFSRFLKDLKKYDYGVRKLTRVKAILQRIAAKIKAGTFPPSP